MKCSLTFSIKISIKLCINCIKRKVAINVPFFFFFFCTTMANCSGDLSSSFSTSLELGARKELSSQNLRDDVLVLARLVLPAHQTVILSTLLPLPFSLFLSFRSATRSFYLYSESDSRTSAHYGKTLLEE